MMLFKFWLRRFAVVFAAVGVLLLALEWHRRGDDAHYVSAMTWAVASAVIAASIATRWARARGCAIPRDRR